MPGLSLTGQGSPRCWFFHHFLLPDRGYNGSYYPGDIGRRRPGRRGRKICDEQWVIAGDLLLFSPLPPVPVWLVMRFGRARTKTSGGKDGWARRAYMSRYCYLRLCLLRYGISEYHWDMGTGGGGSRTRQIRKNSTTTKKGPCRGIWNGRRFFFFSLAPRSSMPS